MIPGPAKSKHWSSGDIFAKAKASSCPAWQQIGSQQYSILKVGLLCASKIPVKQTARVNIFLDSINYCRCNMTWKKQELKPLHVMTGIWDLLRLQGIACWSDSNWYHAVSTATAIQKQWLKSGPIEAGYGNSSMRPAVPWGLCILCQEPTSHPTGGSVCIIRKSHLHGGI